MQTQTIFGQSTRQGLITSGLNHVAHGMVVKKNIKQILKGNDMDPNSSPGNTIEEVTASANKILSINEFSSIKESLRGADIDYEFGGSADYPTPDGKVITLSEGGLMTQNKDNSFNINIFEGSMGKMWKFAFVLGKELYMAGLINNGTFNSWINSGHSRNWASYNLEVQSYLNWVLPYAPNQLGLHNSNYMYWLNTRNRY